MPARDARFWDGANYLEIPDFDEFANIESYHLDGFRSYFFLLSLFCETSIICPGLAVSLPVNHNATEIQIVFQTNNEPVYIKIPWKSCR